MFEKINNPEQQRTVEGSIPIEHRYTPGVAGEQFFAGLKRGELLASRCETCGIVYCPNVMFCERCFNGLEADTKVGPTGTLESYTVVYRGVEGEELDEPVIVGLVRLDGADTVLMHFLVENDHPGVGEQVEAVFQPKSKRTGSIHDLRGFRPAG